MRLLILCLLGILSCFTSIYAKNTNQVLTQVIDWSLYPNSAFPKKEQCKKTILKTFKDVKVDGTTLKFQFKSSNSVDLKLGASYGDGDIDLTCRKQGHNYDGNVKFDINTKEWIASDDNNLNDGSFPIFKLYQLKGVDTSGWLYTTIHEEEKYKIAQGISPYFKTVSFCLFNQNQTKQLCGYGIAQYIFDKKHLGTTAHDYTPILIKILNTAQFLDDK